MVSCSSPLFVQCQGIDCQISFTPLQYSNQSVKASILGQATEVAIWTEVELRSKSGIFLSFCTTLFTFNRDKREVQCDFETMQDIVLWTISLDSLASLIAHNPWWILKQFSSIK